MSEVVSDSTKFLRVQVLNRKVHNLTLISHLKHKKLSLDILSTAEWSVTRWAARAVRVDRSQQVTSGRHQLTVFPVWRLQAVPLRLCWPSATQCWSGTAWPAALRKANVQLQWRKTLEWARCV